MKCFRFTHRDAALLIMPSISLLGYFAVGGILMGQVTVNTGSSNGNGVVMTEGTATAPASGFDAIYAVGSPTNRLKASNNGGSLQLLAVWPCTFTGCMVYASSATGNPETALPAGSTSGLPLLWGGGGASTPGWGGTNLDIQTNSLDVEFPLITPFPGTGKLGGLERQFGNGSWDRRYNWSSWNLCV